MACGLRRTPHRDNSYATRDQDSPAHAASGGRLPTVRGGTSLQREPIRMRLPLLLASALALAACTAHDKPSDGNGTAAQGSTAASTTQSTAGLQGHRARAIAGLPDRGQLLAYTAASPVTRSAYTWHSIALSEAHALNAIASGTLEVP